MSSQMDQCTSSWSTSGALLVNLLQLLLIWTESDFWPIPPCDNERRAVRRCTVEANTWPSKNTGANIPSATSQELMSRTEYFSDLKKSWRTCLFKELQCTLQMLYVTYQLLVPKCWWNSSTIKTNLAYLSNNRNLI